MSRTLTLAMGGQSYGPTKVASTNANQALPAAVLTNASRSAVRVVITVEDNTIRYAFGGIIPTQGTLGHLLTANESLVIGHPASIASFRFISDAANTHGNLQITGEYGTI